MELTFSWMELTILILASFRVTRLLVYDTITEWLRRPFHETIEETNNNGEVDIYIKVKGTGLQAFIGELLTCHWCIGFWVSTVVLLAFVYLPWSIPLLILFAISGGAALLMSLVDREE